jgi:hypothetical protein
MPNRKISDVIIEFGEPLLSQLDLEDKFEMEGAIKLLVTIWNAVALDHQEKSRRYEDELVRLLNENSSEFNKIAFKLIKRKKRKYSNDPRTVGNYQIVEQEHGLTLRAEARLPG